MVLSKEAFCFKYLQLGAARCIGWARVRSSQDVITPNSRMTYSWPSEPPLRWTAKDHSLIRQAQKRSIIRNTCIDWGQHPAFTVVEMCVLTYSYLLEARAKACLLEIWRQEKKNCTAITNILHIHAHTHGHRWAHTLFSRPLPRFTALFDVHLRAILDWISTPTSVQATYLEDGYVDLVIL